jgi:hypothetical protein
VTESSGTNKHEFEWELRYVTTASTSIRGSLSRAEVTYLLRWHRNGVWKGALPKISEKRMEERRSQNQSRVEVTCLISSFFHTLLGDSER